MTQLRVPSLRQLPIVNSPLSRRRRTGFLLIETLLGIVLIGLFLVPVGVTLLQGEEITIIGGDRVRGTAIAEGMMEATRSVRDGSFAALTSGQHGLRIVSTLWTFHGTQTTYSGAYTGYLTVTPLSSNLVRISARTAWKHGYNRSGSVLLTSDLGNWRGIFQIGNWNAPPVVEGTYDAGAPDPLFNDIQTYSGSFVFLSSSAGAGLYVLDIVTNPGTPTRIASAFSLGTGGYDIAIRGNVLYVVTGDALQEIRAYRIASPGALSAANLIASYNLPGSGLGRSIAISGTGLYLTATASATVGENELYAFNIANTGSIVLMNSVDDDNSTASEIALSGTSAYLASSMDISEMRVANITNPFSLTIADGANESGSLDAFSIAVSGTSAILGREKGPGAAPGGTREMILYDIHSGGPPVTPGPWYHEGSGSLVGVTMEPTHCYAFLAADSGRKAFQIVHMRDKSTLSELQTYDVPAGELGRGLLYDAMRDRIFFITNRTFRIFRPGAPTGTCP